MDSATRPGSIFDGRDYSLETAKKVAIARALVAASYNKVKAAKLLGCDRRSLYRSCKLLGISLDGES